MDIVLAVAGFGALSAALALSYRLRRRLASPAAVPEDEYWLTVREAEVLTRSGAPFV